MLPVQSKIIKIFGATSTPYTKFSQPSTWWVNIYIQTCFLWREDTERERERERERELCC